MGLLVGIVVGVLIHISYSRLWELRDHNPLYDFDQDGMPDSEQIWKNGELKEDRWDQNGDGRPDVWLHYRDGRMFQQEVDKNFDGKVDSSYTYSPRQTIVSSVHDTDFNGEPDVNMIYTNGLIHQSDWHPNGTNVIVLRQIFRHGVLNEELRDQNGDGLYDVSIKFDPFSTPVRTNNLRPTTQSP